MALKQSSLVIGRQPLVEALQSGRPLDKIWMQKNASGEVLQTIRQLARAAGVPIQAVPVEKLNGLTRANHQGVIAVAALVQYLSLQNIIDHVVGEGNSPLLVMLDGVTDVRNIGAIARTALCCGAQALIIPDKGVGALNEEAMKSSAGALEKIHVCRVPSLLKAVDELHLNGIAVFTAEMRAEKAVYDMDFTRPCCIIMGDEGRGVQPYLAKAADGFFHIPMPGKFESLNVSVATGMILYEAMKQRR